jgi:hypothetical protein
MHQYVIVGGAERRVYSYDRRRLRPRSYSLAALFRHQRRRSILVLDSSEAESREEVKCGCFAFFTAALSIYGIAQACAYSSMRCLVWARRATQDT